MSDLEIIIVYPPGKFLHVENVLKIPMPDLRAYPAFSPSFVAAAVQDKDSGALVLDLNVQDKVGVFLIGGTYVVGDVHTNTVEGFFSGFKRSIFGIYHHVSKKHLQRYLNEHGLRYNHRAEDNGAAFLTLLENCNGRLTYEGLIANDTA